MSDSQSVIDEFVYWLYGPSLAAQEIVFLAAADNPDACYSIDSLPDAVRAATELADRGVFVSTGVFSTGQPRRREHLVSVPVLLLDADLRDMFIAEGRTREEAEQIVTTCAAD